MDDKAKKLVVQKLNKELGRSYKNLEKVADLHRRISIEKSSIENKISATSNERSSLVCTSLNCLDEVSAQMKQLLTKYDKVVPKIEAHQEGVAKACSQIQGYMTTIADHEKLLAYLEHIECIQTACEEMETALLEEDDEKAVEIYGSLCKLSKPLASSGCSRLFQYLKTTIYQWHGKFYERFKSEYEKLIAAVGWPITSSNTLRSPPSSDVMLKFQRFTKLLLLIEIPENLQNRPSVTSALMIDFDPLVLPVQLLFNPLRKRFMYHFSGSRQTNRADKPEWMLTQVLTWIRDHEAFILQKVQPVFNETCTSRYISVEVELIRGFIKLVVEKLDRDLVELQYDDVLFCHAVDEILAFAYELRDSYNYPSSEPSVLMVLTQPELFMKWINMERKYALTKLDSILESKTAWTNLSSDDDDELKVTECADCFLTLLSTITERYSALPQPRHKLEFLNLQLDLIDEFQRRLSQEISLFNEEVLNMKAISIINSINYICDVFLDWGTNTHFLLLYHYKLQLEQVDMPEATSVFDGKSDKLQSMLNDLVQLVCMEVVFETKARSKPYRRDKWFAMPSIKNTALPSLTASACPMFQVLADRLHFLQKSIASPLFQNCWKIIAKKISQFILEELILENTFNQGGAEQLHFDVTRNLIPLFSKYTSKPEQYFRSLEEACIILTEARIPPNFKITALRKADVENVLSQRLQ
ncbi:unnamed protein product [Bemisia tabaci]|uniref:RAD50-interacting protein 1 n=1 Tax=Bemisia tabaci TaxID=7038 RepID=A0A9P0F6W9_BEMTA|nr:PREDICTED: RAD50-interacting protein 1 [Bemisia tabaci]CAH0394895.1 unnamed protein product [Bemisia tabaci]